MLMFHSLFENYEQDLLQFLLLMKVPFSLFSSSTYT